MPNKGRVELDIGSPLQRAEILKPAQVVKVDLAVVLALGPAALGVRASIQEQAVGVAPQRRDRVQLEGNDFVNIFLLRKVTVDAVIGDTLGETMPLLPQLLLVEINPGLFRRWVACCLVSARQGLGDSEGQSAPTGHLHHRQGRNLQPPFGPTGTAVEKVPQPERLFAALRNKRGIRRRD